MPSIDARCSIEGCDELVNVKRVSMCRAHYMRLWKYGDPLAGRPPGPKRSSLGYYMSPNRARDDLGRKRCVRCDKWLDVEFFKANSHMSDKLLSYCKRCCTDGRHHLALSRRNKFLRDQDGKCAISACDSVLNLCGSGTYHIDHDHGCCAGIYSCGDCIRGLTCGTCNGALGYARDNPTVLLALADYLIAHNEGTKILDV